MRSGMGPAAQQRVVVGFVLDDLFVLRLGDRGRPPQHRDRGGAANGVTAKAHGTATCRTSPPGDREITPTGRRGAPASLVHAGAGGTTTVFAIVGRPPLRGGRGPHVLGALLGGYQVTEERHGLSLRLARFTRTYVRSSSRDGGSARFPACGVLLDVHGQPAPAPRIGSTTTGRSWRPRGTPGTEPSGRSSAPTTSTAASRGPTTPLPPPAGHIGALVQGPPVRGRGIRVRCGGTVTWCVGPGLRSRCSCAAGGSGSGRRTWVCRGGRGAVPRVRDGRRSLSSPPSRGKRRSAAPAARRLSAPTVRGERSAPASPPSTAPDPAPGAGLPPAGAGLRCGAISVHRRRAEGSIGSNRLPHGLRGGSGVIVVGHAFDQDDVTLDVPGTQRCDLPIGG